MKIISFRYEGLDFYNTKLITWKYFLENYEFEEGEPCGKYIK